MDQRTLDALRKRGLIAPATDEQKMAETSRDESPAIVQARKDYTARMQAAVA